MVAIELKLKGDQYYPHKFYYDGKGLLFEPYWFDNEIDAKYSLSKYKYQKDYHIKLIYKEN